MKTRRVVVRDAVALVAQIASLYLLSRIAEYVLARFAIPLPAGALGLALLFALLASGALPLAWIERGASLLVRHLGLFLTPYAVGLMAFGDLMLASGLALLVVLIASTASGMAATGWVAQAVTGLRARRLDFTRRIEQ
jgi:holin-like protein